LRFCKENKNTYKLFVFTAVESVGREREAGERMGSIFKKVYTAGEIGYAKADPQAYSELASAIQEKPENVLFVDDTGENVQAAQHAGFHALQFHSNKKLFEDIKSILS